MAGEGHNAWGSIVKESAYGTAPGSGEVYFEVVRSEIDYDAGVQDYPSVKGAGVEDVHLGHVRCSGPVIPMLPFEGALGLFLEGFFGEVVSTGASAPYTHTFNLKDALESYNFEINMGNVPSGDVFRYDGVTIDTFSLDVEPEIYTLLNFGLHCQNRVTDGAASGTPSYPGDYPILFHHTSTITIAAEATLQGKVKRISLRGNNNMDKDRYFLSRLCSKPVRTDAKRQIDGSALLEFEDLNLLTKKDAATQGAFLLTLESDLDIPASSPTTKFSLSFLGAASFVSSGEPKISNAGKIELPVDFRILGSTGLQGVLKNGEASY